MLPGRRIRSKMGVKNLPRRIFQTHRAYVKRHRCAVPGCINEPVEFAHVKTRGSGGHDAYGIPLCALHHAEQHRVGILTVQRKYGVDFFKIAAEFARTSTDKAMREAIRENPALLLPPPMLERVSA